MTSSRSAATQMFCHGLVLSLLSDGNGTEVGPVAMGLLAAVLEENLASYPKGVGLSLHFTVVGIEALLHAIVEEDMEIVYPLRIHPYGIKDVWCRDPDGYLVVLEERTRK